VPDDEFQFDAERHAELVAVVTVLLGQFVAVEPEFGRQPGPAVALVVGEFRPAVALVVGEFRPAVALIVGEFRAAIACRQLRVVRQRGFVFAERIPVRRVIGGWRLQRWRFRATPTAAATRLAHASCHRRLAGQHALIVRSTVRRGLGRGRAWHPG
jgi:uncharacterized protein YqgC (DUF456 family)